MILIRLVVQILVVLFQVGACFLAILLFLGRVKSKHMSQSHLPRLNIEPCHLLDLKLHGFKGYLVNLVFHSLLQLLFMLITLVLFKLLPIMFSMSAPSILRWIVISFVKHLFIRTLLFLTFPPNIKLLSSLPRFSLVTAINS